MRSVRRQGDGRTHAWTHASALGAAMSVMRSAVAHTPGEVMCSLRGASSSVAGKSTATVLTLASVVSRRSAEAIGESSGAARLRIGGFGEVRIGARSGVGGVGSDGVTVCIVLTGRFPSLDPLGRSGRRGRRREVGKSHHVGNSCWSAVG